MILTLTPEEAKALQSMLVPGDADQLVHVELPMSILLLRAGKEGTSPPPPPPAITDGLLAFWNLDEGTMENRLDASGNGNTLTPFGTVDGDPNGLIDGMAVMSSGAYLGRSTSLFTAAPFSVSCWVQVQEFGINQIIFCQGTSSANRQYLGIDENERIILTSATESDLLISSTVVTGSWQHLVWTCDGSTHRLYVDGTLAASGGASPSFTGVDRFRWGAGINPPINANIWLDLCGVWNRELSAADVTQLYNAGAGFDPTA